MTATAGSVTTTVSLTGASVDPAVLNTRPGAAEQAGPVNATALRGVVAMIALAPQQWNQRQFVTPRGPGRPPAYCLASWTVKLAGMDLAEILVRDGGPRVYVVAMTLLGLSVAQAARLFYFGAHHSDAEAHPTVDDLRARITGVTGVTF